VTVGGVGLAGVDHLGDRRRKAAKLEREDHFQGWRIKLGVDRYAEDRSPGSHAGFGDEVVSGEAVKVASRRPVTNPRE
jgi:hypothetical protein